MDVDGILTDYERLTSFVDQQTGCLVIRSVPAGDGGFCPAVGYLEVQQAYFSDTFILWMDYDAFRHSLRCAAIFSATAFHLESQFEESTQLWLGVSCGVTFNQDEYRGSFDPRTVLAYKEHQNPENKYKIPGLVLDWPRRWRTSRNDDPKKYLDSLNTDQAFAHYYLNTKRFID